MSNRSGRGRRDLLKLCSLAGLGLAAPVGAESLLGATPGEEAAGAPYGGPYYVVINASGGWDTTYLMDPKGLGGINRLYRRGDILTEGAHTFAPNAKQKQGGLSNEDFYAKYARELLTFNGLDYSVNNHSPGSRYMATGKLDSLAYPTFAALVAACRGPETPLAFLTFGNYSATGNLVPISRVPYVPSLKRIAGADAVEGNERSPYHDDFALDRVEAALAERATPAGPTLPRVEQAHAMLYAAQANSKALSRVTAYLPKTIPKERLGQQAEIALACFRAGVGVSANLTIGQFDSHANNDPDQMRLIPELLAGIDYVLRRAEDLGLRDRLVVIAQSEMGRTPNYNNGNGKDHWSIGSIVFLGPGIRGDRVLGATDEGQFPLPFDPSRLTTVPEGGVRVRPEHIHTALREFAGIADHPFSRKFPLVVPDAERLVGFWG